MSILKTFAKALSYPEGEEYFDNLSFILGYLPEGDIKTLQEMYVETFDFSESSCLYLSSHMQLSQEQKIQLFLSLKDFISKYSKTDEQVSPDYIPLLLDAYDNFLFQGSERNKFSAGLEDTILEISEKMSKELKNLFGKIFEKLSETLKTMKEAQLCLK